MAGHGLQVRSKAGRACTVGPCDPRCGLDRTLMSVMQAVSPPARVAYVLQRPSLQLPRCRAAIINVCDPTGTREQTVSSRFPY